MTTHHLRPLFYTLLLATMLLHGCHRSEKSIPPKEKATSSQSYPIIVGTPPSSNPAHNPYNDTNLVGQYIRSIFQDTQANLWFGTAGQSVARYNVTTLEYYSRDAFAGGNKDIQQDSGLSVHAMAEDQAGNVWFGTHHGVVKYDGKNFKSYTQQSGLSNTQIGRGSVLVDKSGQLWVGTQAGVFRYSPAADNLGSPYFSRFPLLPPIAVKDIMEDQSGHIWFATAEEGVFRYDGRAIEHITGPEGLGDNVAGGIAQDQAGHMWFTMQHGICRYDGQNFTKFTTQDGLGGSEIWGIYIEQDADVIWVTARGSTTRFDPSLPASDPDAFRVFTVEDGLNCCVQSMYQDRTGRMWWGTGQGLYRFDGQNFYQVKQDGPW